MKYEVKYDLSFLEFDLRELLKKLKKHNTYAKQLEDEIILYAQENARLKEKNEELRALYESEREVKEDYKSKNNKAIEYIKKNCIVSDTWKDLDFCNFVPIGRIKYKSLSSKKVENLLGIFKGVDKK